MALLGQQDRASRMSIVALLALAACDSTPASMADPINGMSDVPFAGSGGMASAAGAAGSGGMASTAGAAGAPIIGEDAAAGTGGTPTTDAGAADGAAAKDGAMPTTASGILPSVSDLAQPGPFTATQGAGPAGYKLFHPQELGENGVQHPLVAWGPGAAENAGSFTTLLNHLASHGFVVLSYDATPNGQELVDAIDWMVAENERSGGMFHQKLDTSRIAAGGHSAGSLATFRIGADPRLLTTLHISGGTFDPHTDIMNLHAPALFICGEPGGDGLLVGDVARANCDIDFDNTKVPTFYGITKGASHMTPTELGDATLRSYQLAAIAGWLRFQIADDTSLADMFVGNACTLCGDPNWTVEQKNWK